MKKKFNYPSVEDFNAINSFATSVLDVQRVLGLIGNHFELLKRVGNPDDLQHFCYSLIAYYESEICSYKDNLPLTNKDK